MVELVEDCLDIIFGYLTPLEWIQISQGKIQTPTLLLDVIKLRISVSLFLNNLFKNIFLLLPQQM